MRDDRRRVLRVLGAAVCVACSGGDATDGGADASSEPAPCSGLGTHVGAIADFPIGTWTLHGAVIVAQDSGGLFAFTGICTHQGCVVSPPASDGSTVCPCHGSQFDGEGDVLAGPATAPLAHYVVTTCDGEVYVNANKVVVASTRTPA